MRSNNCAPAPISEQLNSLRKMQASGQLLIAIGGGLAFLSLIRQIPLYAQQAEIIQSLQVRVRKLENKVCGKAPEDLLY